MKQKGEKDWKTTKNIFNNSNNNNVCWAQNSGDDNIKRKNLSHLVIRFFYCTAEIKKRGTYISENSLFWRVVENGRGRARPTVFHISDQPPPNHPATSHLISAARLNSAMVYVRLDPEQRRNISWTQNVNVYKHGCFGIDEHFCLNGNVVDGGGW